MNPRDEVEDSIEEGQVYSDARTGERVELIYIDRNIYVFQAKDETHRLGKRGDLEKEIGSGRYSLTDEDSFAVTEIDSEEMMETIDFENLDNIGETAASNLNDAGYETVGDVSRASDDELLEIAWLGEKGVESIRNI